MPTLSQHSQGKASLLTSEGVMMADARAGMGLNALPQWVEALSPPIAFRTPVVQT
jgi:hypothetical protein